MSLQSPTFTPDPKNLPEVLGKARDMSTIVHHSALSGEILWPARMGVTGVLRSKDAQVFIFPSIGTGDGRRRLPTR